MDMEIINEMVENNKPHDLVMDRIFTGKDLLPEIEKIMLVDPKSKTTMDFRYNLLRWDFATNFSGIDSSRIKNIFVNPDFGKEGLQS